MPWRGPSAAGSALQQVPGLTRRGEGEEEEVAHITSHTPPIQQSPVWRGEEERGRSGGGGEVDSTMKGPGREILCGSWHKSSHFWHKSIPFGGGSGKEKSESIERLPALSTLSRSPTSNATTTIDVFNGPDNNGNCPASVYDSVE